MLRVPAIAVMFALAVPTLAMAQQNNQHHPVVRAVPGAKALPRGFVAPRGPVVRGPVLHGPAPLALQGRPLGPGVHQFNYGGHTINRVRVAPFAYPAGWAYRRWAVGGVLPALFLAPAYYYAQWAALGLPPPQPGFQWVRYGSDLLLVNVSNGQVVDVAYGVFY